MTPQEHTKAVLIQVMHERNKQDAEWGEQNHDLSVWGDILGEEVGEVAKATLEARFRSGSVGDIRDELIQVAAVAVAMIECIDRDVYPRFPALKRQFPC